MESGRIANGVILRYHKGQFHKQAALLFTPTGMVGGFIGSGLTHLVFPQV